MIFFHLLFYDYTVCIIDFLLPAAKWQMRHR